jgi:hypothetical protein
MYSLSRRSNTDPDIVLHDAANPEPNVPSPSLSQPQPHQSQTNPNILAHDASAEANELDIDEHSHYDLPSASTPDVQRPSRAPPEPRWDPPLDSFENGRVLIIDYPSKGINILPLYRFLIITNPY